MSAPVQRRSLLVPDKYADLRPVFDALLRDVLRDADVRNAEPVGVAGLVYVAADGTVTRLRLGTGLQIVNGELRAV